MGWTPDVFWGATLGDLQALDEGVAEQGHRESRRLSWLAHWILAYGRGLAHARTFRPPKPTDLYDPDKKIKTDEEVQAEREEIVTTFPATR